jgi:thiol-disulfide isomerase/thioredoxin
MTLAFVCFGCGARPSGDAGAPSAKPTGPEATTPAEAKASISGTLRAHDGSALRAGEVTVRRDGFIDPIAKQPIADDGSFRVELDPGLYRISIGAVDHAQAVRIVLLEKELRITGNLGTYARSDFGPELPILGEFIDGAGEVLAKGPTSATRVEDGVYRLDLTSAPRGATRLRYQLRIGTGRTANGPVAESYESDGGGDYWSIVSLADRKELVLELSAMPRSGLEPALRWEGEDATMVALRDATSKWERELREIIQNAPRKDDKVLIRTAEYEAQVRRLVDTARQQADAAQDVELRTLLRAGHLMTFAKYMDVERARDELRWFIAHVPTEERRLGIVRGLEPALFHAMTDADAELVAAAETWIERFVRESRDPGPALAALGVLLYFAEQRADEARVHELYALATASRFAGGQGQQYLARTYDPARVLQRGKPLPDFDFAMLGDERKRVTKAERAGRLYIVEFWATWCAPCVVEMPRLHETYAAINGAQRKGKGEAALRKLKPVGDPKVEFVFVSLDTTPNVVTEFRRKHWSMPWTHAFVGKGVNEAEVMERFGFSGVPMTILVDATGTIIEYGSALQREKLRGTLERVLAKQPDAR